MVNMRQRSSFIQLTSGGKTRRETELLQGKIFSDLITVLISTRKKQMQSDLSAYERGRGRGSF